MGTSRANIALLLFAPFVLFAGGCANLRLPAIDPSGQRIFLPSPSYTEVAPDGPLGRVFSLGRGTQTATTRAAGPYEPALFSRHRQGQASPFRRNRGFASSTAFSTPPLPPLCGPDGMAPDGVPCYPIGSPTDTSLSATLPRALGQVGTGVAGVEAPTCDPCVNAETGIAALAGLGPGVVLARKQIIAPVGEEVIVVGAVQSATGVTRPAEPVQWSLSNDSAGTIVDAAGDRPNRRRGGLFRFLPRSSKSALRGCGNCVQSITAGRDDVLTRNPIDPNDDVYLSRGQTWVSLTSGSEGVSYVTLAAPQLEGRRQSTASVMWVDARVHYPQPVLSSLEGPAQLTTQVVRRTNSTPLTNWLIRYTVLNEGVDARLNQEGDKQLLVPTDDDGRANLNVYPNVGQPGTTRIGIEVFKPVTDSDETKEINIGSCIGYVTWSRDQVAIPPAFPPNIGTDPLPPTVTPTPSQPIEPTPAEPPPVESPPVEPPPVEPPLPERTVLSIESNGPPSATLGDTVSYRITVRNTGNAEAQNVIVSTTLPDSGLEFVDSDVQPYSDGREIAWRLGNLEIDAAATVTARFRANDAGALRNVFYAQALNTGEVNSWIRTTVNREALSIDIAGPEPFSPRVGEKINFEIVVTNNTERPISVKLNDVFDPGLEAVGPDGQTSPRAIEWPTFLLPPGPSDPISVQFVARDPGTFTHRVGVEGYPAQQIGTVTVAPAPPPAARPSLKIGQIRGPRSMPAGSTERFSVTVLNDGNTTVTGVRIDYQSNADLLAVGATDGYEQSGDGVLAWTIKDADGRSEFPPNTSVQFELQLKANPSPTVSRPRNSIRVTSDQGVGDEADVEVEVLRSPEEPREPDPIAPEVDPGRLTAFANARPESVLPNEPIRYSVTVRNQSQQSFRDVYVMIEIADKMEFSSPGSGPPGTNANTGPSGLVLQFSAVREIRPGEELVYEVDAEAGVSGTARMRAQVDAIELATPLTVGWETEVK